MTHTQYRDELRRSKDAIDYWKTVEDCSYMSFWENEISWTECARRVTISEDMIAAHRSHRASLVSWWYGSRIGSAPHRVDDMLTS